MALAIVILLLLILGATRLDDTWFRSTCRWLLLVATVEAALISLHAIGAPVGPVLIGVPG